MDSDMSGSLPHTAFRVPSPRRTAIVFLDIDGVLHPIDASADCFLQKPQLLQLQRIVEICGARIVLSSTWRLKWSTADEAASGLTAVGLELPIGATPDLKRRGR